MNEAESELLDDVFLTGEKLLTLNKKWREQYQKIRDERDNLRTEISAVVDNVDELRAEVACINVEKWKLKDERNKLNDEIKRLRACIERIDSINDSPATFNKEIEEAIANAITGRAQNGFRSILRWEKKDVAPD